MRTSKIVLHDELLTEMRGQRQHMAMLLDEHGTAVGVVTMEDILEQIVGDIRDEYDTDHKDLIERLPDGTVQVRGRAQLDTVRRELGLQLDEHRAATFGGYLIEMFGRVPGIGEALHMGNWRAVIDDRDDATITSVTLQTLNESEGSDAQDRER